jgi:hypothetical protein
VCVSTRFGDWWLRLFGVFPEEDFESGSVFGLIIGDPDPGTPSWDRVVPVCNTDLSLPTPPHTASGQARRQGVVPSACDGGLSVEGPVPASGGLAAARVRAQQNQGEHHLGVLGKLSDSHAQSVCLLCP